MNWTVFEDNHLSNWNETKEAYRKLHKPFRKKISNCKSLFQFIQNQQNRLKWSNKVLQKASLLQLNTEEIELLIKLDDQRDFRNNFLTGQESLIQDTYKISIMDDAELHSTMISLYNYNAIVDKLAVAAKSFKKWEVIDLLS